VSLVFCATRERRLSTGRSICARGGESSPYRRNRTTAALVSPARNAALSALTCVIALELLNSTDFLFLRLDCQTYT
jgi:hypothetical protein